VHRHPAYFDVKACQIIGQVVRLALSRMRAIEPFMKALFNKWDFFVEHFVLGGRKKTEAARLSVRPLATCWLAKMNQPAASFA
jgi:hypothetical protein